MGALHLLLATKYWLHRICNLTIITANKINLHGGLYIFYKGNTTTLAGVRDVTNGTTGEVYMGGLFFDTVERNKRIISPYRWWR